MRKSSSSFLLSFALLFVSSTFAAEPEKILQTRRLVGTIKIDGRLDESDWQNLPVATDFIQTSPDFGSPATLKTEVKVLYDNNYLYIGARMHHSPGKADVVSMVHRRDQDSTSDWFGVYIDSLLDHSTAFAFFVNAGGVQRDGMFYNDTQSDFEWDGVWESAVSIDEDGWTAELKIPLALLRIRPGSSAQSWGINFSRQDEGTIREYTVWGWVPRGQSAFVSRFPLLTGIDGLKPKLRREFTPYISTQRKFETTEQSYDDRGWTNRIGLDAHLGITSSSQLDLTVWPDFGQVEVDQSVINLSTIETFISEKRPFFLEGAEIFRVIGQNLFYSRRIGRGVGTPYVQSGETLLDVPKAADIGLAAKYTAKLSSGLNIGVLGASVESVKAELLNDEGEKIKREIYPMTNFGVMRVKQSLGEHGSYIGGFASYMRQASDTGREAQTYAVDGIYRSQNRSTVIQTSVARSDAGYRDEESAEGYRAYLMADHAWKNGLGMNFSVINAGKTFDPNDVGYLARADEQKATYIIAKQTDRQWWVVRDYYVSLLAIISRDQAGTITRKYLSSSLDVNLTNFWRLSISADMDFSAYNDRELRTFREPVKKYLKKEDRPSISFSAGTATNKPYCVGLSLGRTWYEGGPTDYYSLGQTIKLHSSFEIQLGSEYTRAEGERSHIEKVQGVPITGLRNLSQFEQTVRFSYASTTNLSFQFFAQWLAGTWAYRDFKSYVDDDTLANWANEPSYTADSYRDWIVNLIARWEFRPGSTAYLVYTHSVAADQLISQTGGLSPWKDLSLLRHLPSDDVIQLKVSWKF